ncbi:MAG TPA: hypothetical protein VFA54_07420 [Bryobacterales bacterium]|nr:hypothetical protein [Bryobacterales bacterium]
MKGLAGACGLILLLGTTLIAQNRDFLTDDEISQIREAQEPNERLTLYLKFARLRLELLKQAMAVEKPGRAKLIHDNLEDYTHIIEAIDSVIDDALLRKADLTKTIGTLAAREKEFVATLEGFAAQRPKDRYLYDFALKDALETTQDSLDESQQDLKERAHRLAVEDAGEKKERESMMTPAEQESKKAEEKKAGDKAKKSPKAPTLRRKGEAPDQP